MVHLAIAAANFLLPQKLQYKENLAKVPTMIRQIFLVHSAYIVFVLTGFAILCLFFAEDLAGGSRLGVFLSGYMSLFWLSRVIVHVAYYDRSVKEKYPVLNAAFLVAIVFLAGVLALAALASLH